MPFEFRNELLMEILQEPMPMGKSHISQQRSSSGPGKHKVTGRVLFRFWYMLHLVGKCAIFAWVLAVIPWPVRHIKAAMQKSCLSARPFSAWIVSWSWDKDHLFIQCDHTWLTWTVRMQYNLGFIVYIDHCFFLQISIFVHILLQIFTAVYCRFY